SRPACPRVPRPVSSVGGALFGAHQCSGSPRLTAGGRSRSPRVAPQRSSSVRNRGAVRWRLKIDGRAGSILSAQAKVEALVGELGLDVEGKVQLGQPKAFNPVETLLPRPPPQDPHTRTGGSFRGGWRRSAQT